MICHKRVSVFLFGKTKSGKDCLPMQPMKKALAFALALFMALSIGIFPVSAAESTPTQLLADQTFGAELLNSLGLFKGTDQGYELERVPNRTEASVMLVRLLGKEAEALAGTTKHPFVDVPHWADRYIAYMYDKGLTKGVSATTFDANASCTAQMFVTFVLRSLGFSDTKGDFKYSDSISFARLEDVITSDYMTYLQKATFTRGDMALIAAEALFANLKDQEQYMIEKLMAEGAVPSDKAMGYLDSVDAIFMLNYADYLRNNHDFINEELISTFSLGEAGYQPRTLKTNAQIKADYGDTDYRMALVYTYTYPDGSRDSYERYYSEGYIYEKSTDGTKGKYRAEDYDDGSTDPDSDEWADGYFSFVSQIGAYAKVDIQELPDKTVITRTLSDQYAKDTAYYYLDQYYADMEGVDYVLNVKSAVFTYTLNADGAYLSDDTYLEYDYMDLENGIKLTIKVSENYKYLQTAPTITFPSFSDYQLVKN